MSSCFLSFAIIIHQHEKGQTFVCPFCSLTYQSQWYVSRNLACRTNQNFFGLAEHDRLLARTQFTGILITALEYKLCICLTDGLRCLYRAFPNRVAGLAVAVEDNAELGVAFVHSIGHHVPVTCAVAKDHQRACAGILGSDEVSDDRALAGALGSARTCLRHPSRNYTH